MAILGFLRRHKWKILIAAVVLFPIGSIAWYAVQPAEPEYVTAVAEKGDLRQTVEAVGTVISERDLHLQFPSSGVVAQIFVKEGDKVGPGQRLAALRAGNLAADVSSALGRLRSAEAELRRIMEGTRPEEIAVTEAEVANKKSSLQVARTTLENAQDAIDTAERRLEALNEEAAISLSGYVASAGSSASKELTAAQNSLSALQDVLGNNDVVDAVIKYDVGEYNLVRSSIQTTDSLVREIYVSGTSVDAFDEALSLIERSYAAITSTWNVTNRTFDLLQKLPETEYFDSFDKETHKATVAAERTTLQAALSALDSQRKTLRDASANFSTRIAAEEASLVSARGTRDRAQADIQTYETSLRITEAQLQLKKAPARQTDVAVAQASVQQARASLARAQADLGNTVITAPIAGTVTQVHLKVGELAPIGDAITMIGESPYRIEMFVSEIDVPKVQATQSGSIELDAFPGTHFSLRVSQIDTSPTDREGVSKYKVKLDFVYPHDELKIGMTGDAVIITDESSDVVTIPARAVLEREDGSQYVRVLGINGELQERVVTTGLEGEGGNVSVTGIEEGETVIVLEKE